MLTSLSKKYLCILKDKLLFSYRNKQYHEVNISTIIRKETMKKNILFIMAITMCFYSARASTQNWSDHSSPLHTNYTLSQDDWDDIQRTLIFDNENDDHDNDVDWNGVQEVLGFQDFNDAFIAIYNNQYDVLSDLLNAQLFDPNDIYENPDRPYSGQTLLTYALLLNNVVAVDLLLRTKEWRINVNQPNQNREYPATIASQSKNLEIFLKILSDASHFLKFKDA